MTIVARGEGAGASSYQKGLGLLQPSHARETIAAYGWNLLRGDLSLPAAVLSRDAVEHNLRWMEQFVAAYGVKLAPHGKTSMAPYLFRLQMEHGAWGITLATAHQTAIAYQHGIRRVLLANQLVGVGNMRIISELLRDPAFEFICLVDSPELVDQLGAFFQERGQRLAVLLELGVAGGRCGVRSAAQAEAVLAAVDHWHDSLKMRGVEVYEGVLKEEGAIRTLLAEAVAVARRLAAAQPEGKVILSGAGSAWYDVVAEVFAAAAAEFGAEVVLRPGCYVTSDAGIYRAAQKRIQAENPVAAAMPDSLQPALQIWSYVQAVPEPGLAILTMGKRDVAFDAGLPAPVLHFRPGWEAPRPAPSAWSVHKIMDQHAYMAVGSQDEIRVGDMVGCDISHPCLTFDKWRYLAMVDAAYNVVDLIETFF